MSNKKSSNSHKNEDDYINFAKNVGKQLLGDKYAAVYSEVKEIIQLPPQTSPNDKKCQGNVSQDINS